MKNNLENIGIKLEYINEYRKRLNTNTFFESAGLKSIRNQIKARGSYEELNFMIEWKLTDDNEVTIVLLGTQGHTTEVIKAIKGPADNIRETKIALVRAAN